MSKRVLVLEDDAGSEAIICRVIRQIDPNSHVDCEESAEFALSLLERAGGKAGGGYDLIVADIFLSGKVTGLEFWEKVRDKYPDVPILFISSLPVDRFFSSVGRETIAPPFLPKPFHAGECKQMIQGLLTYH